MPSAKKMKIDGLYRNLWHVTLVWLFQVTMNEIEIEINAKWKHFLLTKATLLLKVDWHQVIMCSTVSHLAGTLGQSKYRTIQPAFN